MRRPLTTRRARVLLATLAAAGLTVAGCGSDDEAATTTAKAATPTAAASTTTTTSTTDAAPGTAGTAGAAGTAGTASDEYCDAAMAINTAANGAGDPDEDPGAFAEAVIGPAKAAAALAPSAIADQYAVAIPAMQSAIDGDSSKFGDLDQAGAQIDEFNAANCAWTKVPVTMENYHFTGIPDTLAAGDYTFELSNTGSELHVMVILERKPGVTESFDELLTDPDAESKLEAVVGGGASPGGTASAVGHLDAGEYLVVCPIPVGSTGETEGTGPPHFTLGMHQVLTVTA